MKKLLRFFTATVFVWLGLQGTVLAVESDDSTRIPPAGKRVTDVTGTLSTDAMQRLSVKLEALEQRTGAQVAVLIVDSLRGEPIEQYAMRVAQTWKPGRAGVDDGVILLQAKDDRKLRLEVGRGLEGVIPDLIAKRITSEKMVPAFKSKQWEKGFADAIDAIEPLIAKAQTERAAPPLLAPASPPAHVSSASARKPGIAMGSIAILVGGAFAVLGGCLLLWRRSVAKHREEEALRERLIRRRREEDAARKQREAEAARNQREARDRGHRDDEAAAKARLQALREQIRAEDLYQQPGARSFSSRTTAKPTGISAAPRPSSRPSVAPPPRRATPTSSSAMRRNDDDYVAQPIAYQSHSSPPSSPPPAPAPAPSVDFGGGGFGGGGASDSY